MNVYSQNYKLNLYRKKPTKTNLTRTHTRLTALFPGLPRWAGTRKVKPIWILLKQETVSGSSISWAICKSAPSSRQIIMPAPHHSSFFTGRMPFLPPNQQRQSTEGHLTLTEYKFKNCSHLCTYYAHNIGMHRRILIIFTLFLQTVHHVSDIV